jgi:hypothetical protein
MKGFADDPNIAPYIDEIYAYLRARAMARLVEVDQSDSARSPPL